MNNQEIHCLIVDDEPVAREILQSHLSKIPEIKVIAECANAKIAMEMIRRSRIDLLFLDINMPEISGITLANTLNSRVKIIFTTAYRDFAVEGFELRAVDYLLKPISFERLLKAVIKFFEIHDLKNEITKESESNEDNFFFVRSNRKMVKVDFNNVVYIESFGDYIKIHTLDSTIVSRENISTLEDKVPDRFIRIHRSFIVCINHIKSYSNESITMANKELPISRSYKKETLNRLEKF